MTIVIRDMSRTYYRNSQSFYSSLLKLSFVLFLFTNVLLFYFLYERNEPLCIKEGTCRKIKSKMRPNGIGGQTVYFKVLLENFQKVNDEWRLVPRLNSTVHINKELNCSTLHQIHDLKFIAAGWTKSAYKVTLDNMMISMKVINVHGHDMSSCMLEENRYRYECFLIAASKLLREISVLRTISHPNVIKILGYCVPVEPEMENPLNTIAIFQEYGEPINVIKMLQLSWEDRLRISLGLSRLLKHLASFDEPIALNDFRRQQFVVVDGELKLIDVDDVGLQEPKCNNTPCCFTITNKTMCVPCTDAICQGYNEKMNILKTGGHFIRHILPHGAPSNLKSMTLKITSAFEFAYWNSDNILKEMENLATSFKSGWYRSNSTEILTGFKAYKQKDLSSDFDYRCQLTAFGYGCMISVIDAEEAAEICVTDIECKAFVITDITTWTGRRIALFKNGVGNFIDNNATTLYVRL